MSMDLWFFLILDTFSLCMFAENTKKHSSWNWNQFLLDRSEIASCPNISYYISVVFIILVRHFILWSSPSYARESTLRNELSSRRKIKWFLFSLRIRTDTLHSWLSSSSYFSKKKWSNINSWLTKMHVINWIHFYKSILITYRSLLDNLITYWSPFDNSTHRITILFTTWISFIFYQIVFENLRLFRQYFYP